MSFYSNENPNNFQSQEQSQKNNSIPDQKTTQDQVIFKYDGTQSCINLSIIQESGLIKEIMTQEPYIQQTQQKPLQLVLPKWVSKQIFEIFEDYLRNKQLSIWKNKEIEIKDQSLQRLLWVGDYFQIDEFQSTVIQDVIIPRLRTENYLLFLNEAFKKLKACDDSQDIWYMLLNTGMSLTAKNILEVYKKQPMDLQKLNYKILEEIIDRALKYKKNKQDFDQKEMVKLLMFVRQKPEFLDLLNYSHKQVVNKRINFKNHPSISWKLQNISSIINKETNAFKFNDYQWKLSAKMEYFSKDPQNNNQSPHSKSPMQSPTKKQKALRIYLRQEKSQNQNQQQNQQNPDLPQKIITIYFLVKINDKQNENCFTVKNIIADKQSQILLCQFHEKEFQFYENKKLEFTVYLNNDYVHSLLLNYFSQNWTDIIQDQNLQKLEHEDLEIIVKSAPNTQIAQEKMLNFIFNWTQANGSQNEHAYGFRALNLKVVTNDFIQKLLENPVIQQRQDIILFLENELQKKKSNQLSTSRNKYMSPLQKITSDEVYTTSSQNIKQTNQSEQFKISQDFKIQGGTKDEVISSTKSLESQNNLQKFQGFQSQSHQLSNPQQKISQQQTISNSSNQNFKRMLSPSPPRSYQLNNNNNNSNNNQYFDYKQQNTQPDIQQNKSNINYSRENLHRQPQNQLNENQKRQRLYSESESYNINQQNLQKQHSNNNLIQQQQQPPLYQNNSQQQQQNLSNSSQTFGQLNFKQSNSYQNEVEQQLVEKYQQQPTQISNNSQVKITNSRIAYSPNRNPNHQQQQIQNMQNIQNNFNKQDQHSKSGLVQINKQSYLTNSNQIQNPIPLNQQQSQQSSYSDQKIIGLNRSESQNNNNEQLPINKLEKMRGNKSSNSQKPVIGRNDDFAPGQVVQQQQQQQQLSTSQLKMQQQQQQYNSVNNNNLNMNNNFNVNSSSSQAVQQQQQLQQQQNNTKPRGSFTQSIYNDSKNFQGSLAYNKNLFNFNPTQQSQQQQNSSTNISHQQSNYSNQFNNNGSQKNINFSTSSNNNINNSNGKQPLNNSRANPVMTQNRLMLQQEKEQRMRQLEAEFDLKNFIQPGTWLEVEYIK